MQLIAGQKENWFLMLETLIREEEREPEAAEVWRCLYAHTWAGRLIVIVAGWAEEQALNCYSERVYIFCKYFILNITFW